MGSRLWEGAAEQHDGDLSPVWASSSGLRAPGALGTLRIARPSPRSISGKRDLSVRGRRSPAQNYGSPQASGPSLTRKLEAAPGARSISGQRRDGHEGQGHGHGVRPAAGTVGMDGARLTNTNPKIVEVKSTFLSFFFYCPGAGNASLPVPGPGASQEGGWWGARSLWPASSGPPRDRQYPAG